MKNKITVIFFVLLASFTANAQEDTLDVGGKIVWEASFTGSGATGSWAPYLLGSNSGGRHAMKGTAVVSGLISRDFDKSKRFSWTAGAELSAGYQASAEYDRYELDDNSWVSRPWHPAYGNIYQLWAGVKYRGVNLWAGMRDHHSLMVDDELSSGDLTLSNNARAIPQLEVGFIDFQKIPLTKGWVEITGGISYGIFTDGKALEGRYNYWNDHIATGTLFHYKYIYFRTRQDKPFAVTIGVQNAAEFGGTTHKYAGGKEFATYKHPINLRAFWEMIIPTKRYSDGFVAGNQIGTWNLKARYLFKNSSQLEGYFQWHWDDGSGMAKRNKWDGLWGLTYTFPVSTSPVRKILVEYIDMRDQSGPIHWAPYDHQGTTIITDASGGDNYYNNSSFNAWENYGLGLGSAFPKAPLYNSDGYPQFKHTRTQGVHVAANGCFSPDVSWTAKFSYGIARGNGRIPYSKTLRNTSALIMAGWNANKILEGMSISAGVAFDAGSLRGDNFGALVKVSYSGAL